MKILMVSHLYPPFTIGGYEIRCACVAKELSKRGHDVCVVTSSYGCGDPRITPEFVDGIKIYRTLHDYHLTHSAHTRLQFRQRIWRQYKDTLNFIRILNDYMPDIVNWWFMGGLAKAMMPVPAEHGIPDVHWIEDVWMSTLGTDETGESLGWERFWSAQRGSVLKRSLLKPIISLLSQHVKKKGVTLSLQDLTSDYACYISEFQRFANKDMRIRFRDSAVIYGGSSPEKFFHERDWQIITTRKTPLRLLYCGAITESRRLDILLDSLELMEMDQLSKFILTIVGKPPTEGNMPYYDKVKERSSTGKLNGIVTIKGQLSFDQMPEVYANHDVLVFPSARPEGLPLTMVEAMMAGCCVLTAGSGGAAEVVIEAELPLFALDSQIHHKHMLLKLEKNRGWMVECAQRGQKIAMEKFTFSRMVDEFEQVLKVLTFKRGASYNV